jgi:hypothetical protein
MTIEAADEQDGIVSWNARGRFNYAAVIPGIGAEDHSQAAAVAATPVEHHAEHGGHHGAHHGATDDLADIHTWSGGVWHPLGGDLGTGTGTAADGDLDGGHDFGDHGGLDAGHH